MNVTSQVQSVMLLWILVLHRSLSSKFRSVLLSLYITIISSSVLLLTFLVSCLPCLSYACQTGWQPLPHLWHVFRSQIVVFLFFPFSCRWSDLLDAVRSMLPPKAWNSLSPDLYATFWGLTLYDLYVPKSRYESEISKQHAAIKTLEEISDNSNMAITKRKKDKERIQELLDKLISELQKHEQHVASVHQRLSCEKDKWLSSCPDTLKINMEFLQRCIFPRCIFSMPDAVYCATFVHTLHSLGTPFFNTVNHIDVLICKTLHPMICCCTEYEAGRLGRFLYETLKMAYHWKVVRDNILFLCSATCAVLWLYKCNIHLHTTFFYSTQLDQMNLIVFTEQWIYLWTWVWKHARLCCVL